IPSEVETEFVDCVYQFVVVCTELVVFTRVAGSPCELLTNNLYYFSAFRCRACDIVPCTQTSNDKDRENNRRDDSPGKFEIMVIRVELGAFTFLILIFVHKDEHHNTDEHKRNDGYRHCNPEESVCSYTMFGCN